MSLILCLLAEDVAGEAADAADAVAAIEGRGQVEARVWKHDTGKMLGLCSALQG